MFELRSLAADAAAKRQARQARALRTAVYQLPPETRRAMLSALEDEELIVGAYTDRRGRICPMLAAHRRGARTDVGSFPRAWDAFAHARRPRPATQRELEILQALLEEGFGSQPARDDDSTAPAPAAPAPAESPRAGQPT